MTGSRPRRDAARNRERLIQAAREVFRAQGADAPLEEIAAGAGVSRTTLHRHFASREELATAVLDQNVADIEAYALELAAEADAAERLFHYLLDVQLESPWLARIVTEHATSWAGLTARTAAALAPLVEQARRDGRARPDVTTADILLALPMALAVQIASTHKGEPLRADRGRELLHRALFVTAPPR
ncbi:TetR/AcrR family transcriptional regulator [Isoptericola sp. NPDC056578]|uniref:TetR/AcrR family transcriptional regulator n=1 Tax=Isoptericola sp. NPDC056578 TaxID=3345870 RepID=UPI00367DC47D